MPKPKRAKPSKAKTKTYLRGKGHTKLKDTTVVDIVADAHNVPKTELVSMIGE